MKIWLMPSADELRHTHILQPRLAHLRLGATRAPRWHRGGKSGASGKGEQPEICACLPWLNERTVAVCTDKKNVCTDGLSGLEAVYKNGAESHIPKHC